MHTTMPKSGPYAAVAALLASPLPIPPNAPPRAILEAQISHLIDLLDAFDAATEDLEPDADLEPSLGPDYQGCTDLEADDADNEPSLGSLEQVDQRRWSAGAADDSEEEHDGREPDEADFEPSGGSGRTEEDFPFLVDDPWYGPAFRVLDRERRAARRSAARVGKLAARAAALGQGVRS